MWNPVKELKAALREAHDRPPALLWNPVKELKVDVRVEKLGTSILWNPVKELKESHLHLDYSKAIY
mgnify:CR=1 FL=1